MATHDYVIANQSGAAFRTDLNNALAAIVSNNSSSTEPATRYAYQWWADTNAAVMKLRNSSNDGWVEVFKLNGAITLTDGSAGAPSLSFRDDTNTGIFSGANDQFDIATGGVSRFQINSSQITFNDSGADTDFRIEGDNEQNLFYLNAGGDSIGIGTSAPNSGRLHVTHSSGTIGYFESTQGAANVSNIVGNSTDTNSSANLNLQVNSGVTAQGIFRLNANNSIDFLVGATPATVMRLNSGGHLGIGTTTQESMLELGGATNTVTGISLGKSNAGITTSRYVGITQGGNATNLATNSGFQGIEFGGPASGSEGYLAFHTHDVGTNSGERMRIDKSGNTSFTGNMSFNNSSAVACAIDIEGNQVDIGNPLGNGVSNGINPTFRALVTNKNILFSSMWGGDNQLHKHIEFSGGANIFYVGTNDSEVARTDGTGLVVGSSSFDSNSSVGVRLYAVGAVHSTRSNEFAYVGRRSDSNGGLFLFRRDGTDVGNISVTTSATTYNSGSDYRLKQDDTPITDGLTRLKQLKPIKFKFKNDLSAFVDGFFAHEVSDIVPNAITGEKDAVYEEDDDLGHKKGDPIYQQIDHGKLVPLLVAAVQELTTKVEALEAA